jgi:TonB family protein
VLLFADVANRSTRTLLKASPRAQLARIFLASATLGCSTLGRRAICEKWEPEILQPGPAWREAPLAAKDPARYCADAARSGHVTDPKALVRLPEVGRAVFVRYPVDACIQRHAGTVALRVLISKRGTVDNVTVLESAGSDLDAVALDALRRFEFTPGCLADGRPVPVWVTYRYKFELPP